MQCLIALPASGIVNSRSYSREGGMKICMCISANETVNRNKYKISACGDVKFWLHSRKRNCRFWIIFPPCRFWIIFPCGGGAGCKFLCASPLAGMQYFDCISRKRNCQFQIVFPRGGMKIFMCISANETVTRNKYEISACGDVKFWLHSDKRNCRFWIVFPRGGNVNFYVHLRSRECNILIASPQAELSIPDRIPVRGNENFYVHLRKRDREPK